MPDTAKIAEVIACTGISGSPAKPRSVRRFLGRAMNHQIVLLKEPGDRRIRITQRHAIAASEAEAGEPANRLAKHVGDGHRCEGRQHRNLAMQYTCLPTAASPALTKAG